MGGIFGLAFRGSVPDRVGGPGRGSGSAARSYRLATEHQATLGRAKSAAAAAGSDRGPPPA